MSIERDIQQHRSHVLSNDAKKQLASTRYFVSLLSGEWHSFHHPLFSSDDLNFRIEANPPIQQVIDCGVLPYLLRFLQVDNNGALQVEAAGAINKITLSATLKICDRSWCSSDFDWSPNISE